MSIQQPVRVRFAPSPTGHLHIGGLRSAIFNWLFARRYKGAFLLRIEDTDPERSKQEYTDSIIASFAWMRIDWDEPIVIQSERAVRHTEIARHLVAQGKAYYCDCTQEKVIERLSSTPGFDANFIHYDRFCRDKKKTQGALRFRIPETTTSLSWDDLIRGPITIHTDQLDDFIIVRSDGAPMYNFVVVIDDADMRISHIIRGEEHIANTPKQILLYNACNFIVPLFAHLPMILGSDGSKLSKRDAATGVFEYKKMGYLPDALFNYLVRLGWSHGDQEIFTREEVIQLFDLAHVHKKGAIFDQTKLEWLNGVYMRAMADQELLHIILKDIHPTLLTDLPEWHTDSILMLIHIYKQRAKTVQELTADIMALYKRPVTFAHADIAQWINAQTITHLNEVLHMIQELKVFGADELSAMFKEWAKKEGIKMVALAQPLRIALLGKTSGPGVFELMPVLGKKESVARIEYLIEQVAHIK